MAQLLPYIIEIPFKSEKHTAVMTFLKTRIDVARQQRMKRVNNWNKADDLFQSYVKETEVDSRRRAVRDTGIPQFTTITVPYSYATLMTAHTYWTSVFLARDPVLQVQGNNDEAQTSEQAVESLLQYYVITGRNLVPYYIWLLDQGKYGEGIVGMAWDVERRFIPELVQRPRTFMGIEVPGTLESIWTSKELIGYQGVRLFNVRPHDFLFDPNVSLKDFQNGEFAGHDAFVSMVKLKDQEAQGAFYNMAFVKGRKQSLRAQRLNSLIGTNTDNMPGSSSEMPGGAGGGVGDGALGCDLTEITIELVPRDLGLAARDYVEKWSFTIANDEVIVSAQPQGWYHDRFMYDVLEHEIEGYNVSKRGMMEMLQPLNITLDWLFNTHFYNVRKTLNNEFIYDPSILVSKDVEAPGPGKLIRVRPEAYGKDVRASFYQLQTADVTGRHIQDASMVMEMMQRLTGVNDTVMGMLNNSRRTATEVRSSSSFAVNRLKTQCEYYSAMGFAPHTVRMIQVAQQMIQGNTEQWVRIVGNRSEPTTRFINVNAEQIKGQFDYIPVDGTMPIDRQAQASVFTQMLQQMASIPTVAQAYDWARLFGYAAELHGVRNLQRFKVQVVPDGMAAAGAAAGNLVPAGQAANLANNGAGIDVTGRQ
jgi:hypothetical protein